MPSPQTFISLVPNFDAETRPFKIINTDNGTATINLTTGQTCLFTTKPTLAVKCIGRLWDSEPLTKDAPSFVLAIKNHSGELVLQALSAKWDNIYDCTWSRSWAFQIVSIRSFLNIKFAFLLMEEDDFDEQIDFKEPEVKIKTEII